MLVSQQATVPLLKELARQYWPVLLSAAVLAWIVSTRYRTPLRNIPGPFIASWTILPRLFRVAIGRPHVWELRLHKKYGRIVRTGPNQVSVGDPAAINTIYNANDKF